MMAGGQKSFCAEDTQNIPTQMRNLCVRGLDKTITPMRQIIVLCMRQGTSEAEWKAFDYLLDRTATFRERRISDVSTNHLAECGFFMKPNGTLACYQCGNALRLREGEDPLITHHDIFPNCMHIRRLLGKRPRPASVQDDLPQRQITPSGVRRRLFSE